MDFPSKVNTGENVDMKCRWILDNNGSYQKTIRWYKTTEGPETAQLWTYTYDSDSDVDAAEGGFESKFEPVTANQIEDEQYHTVKLLNAEKVNTSVLSRYPEKVSQYHIAHH